MNQSAQIVSEHEIYLQWIAPYQQPVEELEKHICQDCGSHRGVWHKPSCKWRLAAPSSNELLCWRIGIEPLHTEQFHLSKYGVVPLPKKDGRCRECDKKLWLICATEHLYTYSDKPCTLCTSAAQP